jgi:uroporphyrinogen-III synthase
MSDSASVRVALLEGRMSGEIAGLVRRQGLEPYCVPAVREAALDCAAEVAELLDLLAKGNARVVVFQTGVGVTALFAEAERLGRVAELIDGLGRAVVACRGPKPTGALVSRGVSIGVKAKEPFTTTDLVDALAEIDLAGAGVAVLQYGERNEALTDALEARGARVHELCLYEWLLPEDVEPLKILVGEIVDGLVEAVAFTSQIQARHLFRIAAEAGRVEELTAALNEKTVVASVGPTCSAVLRGLGVEPRIEPERPKMGPMIAALAEHFSDRTGSGSDRVIRER